MRFHILFKSEIVRIFLRMLSKMTEHRLSRGPFCLPIFWMGKSSPWTRARGTSLVAAVSLSMSAICWKMTGILYVFSLEFVWTRCFVVVDVARWGLASEFKFARCMSIICMS